MNDSTAVVCRAAEAVPKATHLQGHKCSLLIFCKCGILRLQILSYGRTRSIDLDVLSQKFCFLIIPGPEGCCADGACDSLSFAPGPLLGV